MSDQSAAPDLHVLMISLDDSLVAGGDGSARERHARYAALAGRLTVIAYTKPGFGGPVTHAPGFTAIPTNSRSRFHFLRDGYRLAADVARRERVDVITTQDPFSTGLIGLWLRNRFRAPLLVQNHAYFFGNRYWLAEHPARNRIFHAIGRYVVRRADLYRTVNQQERDTYLADGGAPERVLTLPVAVASARFSEEADAATVAALRAQLGLQPQHRVIIWVGYPVAFKRVPVLLEVFQQVAQQEPDARLLLVGNMAASADDLSALARQLGIADRVLMPGLVPHADLPAYYTLADVYAHTSSYEGLPRVLSEAASAGLPLVGMDCVGVRDVIEDGVNGYLVPDLDQTGMAARLVELLRDPEQARALGAQGRARVLAQYNVADNAARVVDSWRRAVALGLREP